MSALLARSDNPLVDVSSSVMFYVNWMAGG